MLFWQGIENCSDLRSTLGFTAIDLALQAHMFKPKLVPRLHKQTHYKTPRVDGNSGITEFRVLAWPTSRARNLCPLFNQTLVLRSHSVFVLIYRDTSRKRILIRDYKDDEKNIASVSRFLCNCWMRLDAREDSESLQNFIADEIVE